MSNREPWSFCETPQEKCTMNYCDENGCQNRKRENVQVDWSKFPQSTKEAVGFVELKGDKETCECCEKTFDISEMRMDDEDGNWFCSDCIEDMLSI
jgi:hypothetical protein